LRDDSNDISIEEVKVVELFLRWTKDKGKGLHEPSGEINRAKSSVHATCHLASGSDVTFCTL
jgi:hypothetical protein